MTTNHRRFRISLACTLGLALCASQALGAPAAIALERGAPVEHRLDQAACMPCMPPTRAPNGADT